MYNEEIQKYINETYGAYAEHPFSDDDETIVFRHADNKKWFALVMKIPKNKLGIPSDEKIHVMNLKCEFVLASSLFSEDGIFPAYHMNKKHWISVCLDGSVNIERIKWLIDISFDLTKTKRKKRTP